VITREDIEHFEEQQNLARQQRLAAEAKHRLDRAVERAVPDFRNIDSDPRWRRWLSSTDRQTLLDDAVAHGRSDRVIDLVHAFLAWKRAMPPEKPVVYDNKSIAELYARRRRGEFTESEWAWREQDLFNAWKENRVRAKPYFSK
jgi:hypothetical protein